MEIEGYGSKAVVPTAIFDSEYFAENYHYDGNDLGAIIDGDKTTFKLWAPTASKVVLNLFTAGNDSEVYKNVEMVKGDKGVWSHTENCGHGTYYNYTVTTSVVVRCRYLVPPLLHIEDTLRYLVLCEWQGRGRCYSLYRLCLLLWLLVFLVLWIFFYHQM